MGDRVIIFKFFKGIFTEEYGYKRIGVNGSFHGLIQINGEKKRSIMVSIKPGTIKNNFIWYDLPDNTEISSHEFVEFCEQKKMEAIQIFYDRSYRLFKKAFEEERKHINDMTYLEGFIFANEDKTATYLCDPNKYITCPKTSCYKYGGECYRTIHKIFERV